MTTGDPDFFGGSASMGTTSDGESPGFNGFLGLMPVGRGMPGNIKLPDTLAKQLPKPIRDFFKPPTDKKTDQEKEEKKRVIKLRDAAEVVRSNFSDFQFTKALVDWVLENTTPAGKGGNPLAEKIIAELEKKCLPQTRKRSNWRAKPSTGKAGRPKGVKNGQGGRGAIRYRMRGAPGPRG